MVVLPKQNLMKNNLVKMTELEKLVQTWEKYKPIGTPHERIWNGFIDHAKAAIEREKQALSTANVVKSLPDDDEIEQAANEEASRIFDGTGSISEWQANNYRHGFTDGIEWLKNYLTK